jgi:hypothetical protein
LDSASFDTLQDMDNTTLNPQQILDNEHLKLLSIFHYVLGGISALFACIPIVHLIMGLFFILAPQKFGPANNQPPAFIGWFFVIFATCFILLGCIFAVLTLFTGRCIARRKRYMFCFVWACVECVFMPFGTVLGVFTILVLNLASVKELFNPRPAALTNFKCCCPLALKTTCEA